MIDRPRSPKTGDDSGMEYDRESSTDIPRRVKVVGIILAIVALLVVVVLLVGGGGHGPRRHAPPGGTGGHTPPAGINHTPPGSGHG